jgi:hypothetical protein
VRLWSPRQDAVGQPQDRGRHDDVGEPGALRSEGLPITSGRSLQEPGPRLVHARPNYMILFWFAWASQAEGREFETRVPLREKQGGRGPAWTRGRRGLEGRQASEPRGPVTRSAGSAVLPHSRFRQPRLAR